MGILKINNVSSKEIELTEFQCWILERKNWDEQLNIIKQEDWDRFRNSKDEYRELDIIYIDTNDFYNKFEQLFGIYDFDENFVSMEYIDELQNSINLIIDINGVSQRFRIDVA